MKRNLIRTAVALLGVGCVLAFLYPAHSANLIAQKNALQSVDASALFDKHCHSCHGKDGQAKTLKAKFNHARNLTDLAWQSQVSDERLFNSISNGKGKMPAFGKKLSEAQINALVSYVRKLKQ